MQLPDGIPRFDHQQRRVILALARDAIRNFLETQERISPPLEDFLSVPSAAFVTLKKQEELRGCIGSTEAVLPLGETIVSCAISAATRDPRFPSLQREELEQINLEVSVLSLFRQINSVEEIQIGVHGIMLTYGIFRGLLLPQVAIEQNWDREAFLKYTCRKAGLPANAWESPSALIEIFSAEIFGDRDL